MRAEDLLHVSSRRAIGKGDTESNACLNDDEFAWTDHETTHFGLDVQETDLRENEEVAVCVAEGGFVHRVIGGVDVDCEAFFQGRIAIAADSLETMNEVC